MTSFFLTFAVVFVLCQLHRVLPQEEEETHREGTRNAATGDRVRNRETTGAMTSSATTEETTETGVGTTTGSAATHAGMTRPAARTTGGVLVLWGQGSSVSLLNTVRQKDT